MFNHDKFPKLLTKVILQSVKQTRLGLEYEQQDVIQALTSYSLYYC